MLFTSRVPVVTWSVLVASMAIAGAPAKAQDASAPKTSSASVPGAVQFDIESKITGRTYRIYVQGPSAPPPATGFPVIYALDAAASFGTAASQVTLGRYDGWPSAVLVAIGYPDFARSLLLRNRDLTPSQPSGATRTGSEKTFGPIKPDDYGGADAFHRFMVEELRPVIARMYKVDPANQTLVGYSLGGLFALHVMFSHPDAYRTFVAGSPSIWWNDREVLKGEAGFAAAVRSGKAAPRLLITSDEWEQSETSPYLPSSGPERAKEIAEMNSDAMVDNARGLAMRLAALKGAAGYQVEYALFPHETHLTGIPAATSRAISFAIAPTSQGVHKGAKH